MTTEFVTASSTILTTIMNKLTTLPPSSSVETMSSPAHVRPSPTSDALPMIEKLVSMATVAMLSLAITVNLIAFAVVSCGVKRRHTKANIYAVSFFTAEVLYCLNELVIHYQQIFPIRAVTEYEHLILHGHLFVEFMSRGAMVIALGGLVVDRYWAISNMTSYCSRQRLGITCCYALVGWLVATLLAVPILAGLTEYWYTFYSSLRPFDIYVTVHTIVFYFVPVLTVSVAYNGLVCRLVACSGRRSLDSVAAEGNDKQRWARRRLTKIIIATIIVFVCSWLLYLAIRVVDGYFPRSEFKPFNMEVLRLTGDAVAYAGLSVCPMLVCAIAADLRSLDSQRQCQCCSGYHLGKSSTVTVDKVWPTIQRTPYYV